MHLKTMKVLSALVSFILILSCSGGGGGGSTAIPDQIIAVPFDTTKNLAAADLDACTVNANSTLTFPDTNEYAKKLSVNDVIISDQSAKTPHGLLVMVTDITTSGGYITVKTTKCDLRYAFKKLDINITRRLDLAATPTVKNSRSFKEGMRFYSQKTIDWYPFNGDDDTGTPEDQVHVTGTMGGGIDYNFKMSFEWPDFTSWPPSVLPEVKASLEVAGSMDADLHAEGMVANNFSSDEEQFAEYRFLPFGMLGIQFYPSVELIGTLEGNSSSEFDMSMHGNSSLGVEASVSTNGTPGFGVDSPSIDFGVDGVSVKSSAYIKVKAGPRFHLRLWDITGPYSSVFGFTKLEAGVTSTTMNWDLKAGFEGDIGFDIDLWGINILDWNRDFNIYETTLDSGSETIPSDQDPDNDIVQPAQLGWAPWMRRFTNIGANAVFDDALLSIDKTVDNCYIICGTGIPRIIKIDKDGNVLWAKSFKKQDSVYNLDIEITRAVQGLNGYIYAVALNKESPYETYIIKLTVSGNVAAAYKLNLARTAGSSFQGAAADSEGNIYFTGSFYRIGTESNPKAGIIKIDKNLNVIYAVEWGSTTNSNRPVAVFPFGEDVIAAGETSSSGGFVLRITGEGHPVWAKEIAGARIRDAHKSDDGDIIVGGVTNSGYNQKAFIMKIKPDGSHGWDAYNAIVGTPPDYGLDLTSFVQLSDGGYMSSGTWWTGGSSLDNLWIARTDSVGRFINLNHYDSGVDDFCGAVTLTKEGGVLMAGFSGSNITGMRVPAYDGRGSLIPVSAISSFNTMTNQFTVSNSSQTISGGIYLTRTAITLIPEDVVIGE